MKQKWRITETDAGQRLDHLLTRERSELSRSTVQKQIKAGTVTVNGKSATVHQFLKTGDEVKWEEKKTTEAEDTRIKHGERGKKLMKDFAQSAPITLPKIVDESKEYIVLDKPIGLLVHPDAHTKTGTLVDWLVSHDPKIGKVGENPERPGIVHRLDREVSGLIVVAKTQHAYDELKKQFSQRTVKKSYLALVHGEMSHHEYGDIKFRIARSSTKERMAARPAKEEGGKAAWTHYRILERFIGATLLELEILSGRTHQIRAHLYALGHPVIGDKVYVLRRTDRSVKSPRLMLESVALEFTDPTSGERKSYALEPDPAFKELIEEFRKS